MPCSGLPYVSLSVFLRFCGDSPVFAFTNFPKKEGLEKCSWLAISLIVRLELRSMDFISSISSVSIHVVTLCPLTCFTIAGHAGCFPSGTFRA